MSLAASLEKVSAKIWDGAMFSFSTMYVIFAVMVVVLPAPARISWGEGCGFRIEAGGVLGRGRGELTNMHHRKRYAKPQMSILSINII